MLLDAFKISQLPTGNRPLDGTETIVVVQDGDTIRALLSQIVGLAGGGTGTGITVEQLLTLLTGQITESQLYPELATRISFIDASSDVPGSVAAQILAEANARAAADATTLAGAETYVGNYAYQKSAVDSAIAAAVSTVQAQFAAADVTTLASAQGYTYSQADINNAFASQSSTLTAAFTNADAAVLASAQNYTYARASIDGAISASANTIMVSVNGNQAAVQTFQDAQSNLNGQLEAQYYVKTDLNGYVSGFGLYSTAGNGAPQSTFIIRADSFAVASPTGPGIEPAVPFIVRTTSGTINGVPYAVGVYIDEAMISNLSAGKLTAGILSVETDISSTNFASGSTGWQIRGNGDVEFWGTSAVFGGALSAASGSFGAVTIAVGGSISSGQTAYNTGTGFWLSIDSGVPRLSIGSPSGPHLLWDGSNLIIVNPTITLVSMSVSPGASWVTSNITNGVAVSTTRTATVSGGTGPYTYSWSITSADVDNGTTPRVSLSNASSASVTISIAGKNNTTVSAFISCTVIDANGRVAVGTLSVSQSWGTPP